MIRTIILIPFIPIIYLLVIIKYFLLHLDIFTYGDSRIVFLFDKHVIKIPLNNRGIAQSETEIKMWNKYHHKEMCPILFHFWVIIVMPRCEMVNENIDQDYNPFKELEEYNYASQDENDFCNHQNWGILTGELVVVDYGLTKYVNDKYYGEQK